MNKCKTANTIILVKNDKILQGDKIIANAFINYFTDATHFLGLKKKNTILKNTYSKIVDNFRNPECIKKIKKSQEAAENSSFSLK